MRRILSTLTLLILYLCLPLSFALAADMNYVEGEVIVVLKPDNMKKMKLASRAYVSAASFSKASSAAAKIGAEAVNTYPALTQSSGKIFAHIRSNKKSAEELIKELKTNPEVLSVSKNYISHTASEPNDSEYNKQWGMQKINAPEAWETSTGTEDVIAAVIDTGVIYDHPDLKANMWRKNGNEIYGKMFHGNGSSSDITGYGGTDGAPIADWERVGDINGHGTHVAGIIGAVGNNNIGVTGVNQKVKILTVGVFSFDGADTSATDVDIIGGLNYVAELKNSGVNIRAANMSIESSRPQNVDVTPFAEALKAASEAGTNGILFCLAAGNDEINLDLSEKKVYPGAFRLPNTLTVGASTSADKSIYNYSPMGLWVDVAAPGYEVFSTCRIQPLSEYTEKYQLVDASGYKYSNGTSMATPYVTGAAALLASVYPDKTASELKALLTSTATTVCRDGYTKYGQIDVAAAIKAGTPQDEEGSSSSSGGCNTGIVTVLLIAVGALAVSGKKAD